MPDYGHSLEFGVFLPPAADQFGDTLRLAQAADALGLELVSIQDHGQRRRRPAPVRFGGRTGRA